MNMESVNAMDINILLSMVNMRLRDEFSSLERLCDDWNISEEELKTKLRKIGYEYNSEINQFK